MTQLIFSIIEAILEMSGITGAIEDVKRNACIQLYKTGISLWNAMTTQAFTFAGISPANVDAASYQMVTDLANLLVAVAASILTTAYLYRFYKTFNESREAADMYTIIKVTIMLFIAEYAVMNAPGLCNQVIGIGSALCNLIGASSSSSLTVSTDVMDLLNNGTPGIPTMLVMLVFCVCLIVTGAGVLITVVQRLLKLFVMLPFAGMALATVVGGGRVSDVGYSYIRAFIGFCIEGAAIILILIVGNNIVSGNLLYRAFDGIIFDSDSANFWRIVVGLLGQILGCGAISATVKQADQLVHRMFGL